LSEIFSSRMFYSYYFSCRAFI